MIGIHKKDSAQYDKGLFYGLTGLIYTQGLFMRTPKTLIRLEVAQTDLSRSIDTDPYFIFAMLWFILEAEGFKSVITVNPLYTDTRNNDRIRYNDNLIITKLLLQETTISHKFCKNIVFNTFNRHRLSEAILTNIKNIWFFEEIRTKQDPSYMSICSFSIL